MNMLEEVRKMIMELNPGAELNNKADLFDSGLLDSFKIFNELIPKIEENLKIEISPLDLMPENFMDIESLAKFLETKQGK